MNETATALYNRGRDALVAGAIDDAHAHFLASEAEEPGSVWPKLGLGYVYARRGAWDEALACYDHVVAVDPGFADAQTGRVRALVHLGRDDECLEACEALAALEPDSLIAAHEQVRLYVDRRDRSKVLAPLVVCLRHDPAHYGALPFTQKIVALFDPDLAAELATDPAACIERIEALARAAA